MTQTMTPSLSEPLVTFAVSSPRASRAAETAYCVMGLGRRNRACVSQGGRGVGGGTWRTRSEVVVPGRGISLIESGTPAAMASSSGLVPQPLLDAIAAGAPDRK